MLKSRMIRFTIAAVVLWVAQPMVAIGKTTSAEVSKQAEEAWETFKAYMVDQKDEAVAHGNTLLDKADVRIKELEGEAAKASGDTKAEYEKTIKRLKQMRSDAAKKLDDLGDSSADAWDSTKDGFTKAYEDLYDAYKEAVGSFK